MRGLLPNTNIVIPDLIRNLGIGIGLAMLTSLVLAVTPGPALAYDKATCFSQNPNALIPLPNFTNPECQDYRAVLEFLKLATNTAIEFVLAIAFIFLLITGYQFIVSVGDKAAMENAKRSLLYIVIGVLAVLGAFMIVRYVSNQFLSQQYQITLSGVSGTWYM